MKTIALLSEGSGDSQSLVESQVWETCGGVQRALLGVSGPELGFKPRCESEHHFNLHGLQRASGNLQLHTVSSSQMPGASSGMSPSTRFYTH